MLRNPGNGDRTADVLRFAREHQPETPGAARGGPWKLLVVDDEEDVHHVTRLVLGRFRFEERPVELLGAFSAVEARRVLAAHPDVAVILLDVVMERDDAGLRLVQHIRDELGNRNVRIILRTGQPGQAPEQEVVARYDINDYKAKVELTADKLCTSVTSALRAWRDIRALEHSRRSIEHVLEASCALVRGGQQGEFAVHVFEQLLEIAGRGLGRAPAGFAARRQPRGHVLVAGTGPWADRAGTGVDATLDDRMRGLLARSAADDGVVLARDAFCARCRGDRSRCDELVFVLDGVGGLARVDRDLLKVYMANVGLAYANAGLTREIIASQREMIRTLSDIVETRSLETASHVTRVGEMAGRLARHLGLDEEACAVIQLAAPMHDVGKVGIPDRILNKPGRLTDDEFAIMKTHALVGHAILCKSGQRIMQAAARIALEHHERWDGTGYPRGAAGEDISVEGRITAVVDVFDALASRRVYRDALPMLEVLDVLRAGRARHFDPAVVDMFLEHADEFIAVVEAIPDEEPLRPRAGILEA
ncbi:MAG TPA: DUF3369 domain-containing protein [Candidatus Krumholzibacteria bacterium]|nr:DUF3369 domain-containing protein [Candidatus Krumholzibacteria bacterium]